MSLIERGAQAVAKNKGLYELARKKVPSLSMRNFSSIKRDSNIKAFVGLNLGLYGFYCLAPGPISIAYKQYMTLDANSSVISPLTCHLGHTSIGNLVLNTAALWTIGNYHMKKYGMGKFMLVGGMGAALATAIGVAQVTQKPEQTVSGCGGITTALLTYNLLKNPAWFAPLRVNPLFILAGLVYCGASRSAADVCGGLGGGYLAFILAL